MERSGSQRAADDIGERRGARTVIHLDTSFLIRALVPRSAQDRELRKWLSRGEPVGIGAIGWTEFLCGPVEPSQVGLAAGFLGEPAPFSSEDAEIAARLFNLAGRRRGSLADCMVAATALRNDAALATSNALDFAGFTAAGLKVLAVE